MLLLLAGCMSSPKVSAPSDWVFPTSEFMSEGRISFLAEAKQYEEYVRTQELEPDPTFDIMHAYCEQYGGTNKVTEMLKDPFHGDQVFHYVIFRTKSPAHEILKYYEALFIRDGWTHVRDGIGFEAHDYAVRVVRKQAALLRLELRRHPPHTSGIAFSFINMKPAELFGPLYRRTGEGESSREHHVGRVTRHDERIGQKN